MEHLTFLGIIILPLVLGIVSIRYGYLFHRHLCDNYPDKRYLTILDLKAEINGFRTTYNLFVDNEKELDDEYLTVLKHKSRAYLVAAALSGICMFFLFLIYIAVTSQ